MRAEPESLEAALGLKFADPGLLDRALTHRSLVNERQSAHPAEPDVLQNNEQLEFLGDSVLGFLVSDCLVSRYPHLSEGRLSAIRAHIVSAAHLQEAARRLHLGKYLKLGRGEERTGGRDKATLLVDALEAVIAAIYLDRGIDCARAFIESHVIAAAGDLEPLTAEEPCASAVIDFKGALHELVRAEKLPAPRFTTVREIGPEHSKTFTVEVRVGHEHFARGEGQTKKAAAQKAAREVYERLRNLKANDGNRPATR
jgi:ribonuclease-3